MYLIRCKRATREIKAEIAKITGVHILERSAVRKKPVKGTTGARLHAYTCVLSYGTISVYVKDL